MSASWRQRIVSSSISLWARIREYWSWRKQSKDSKDSMVSSNTPTPLRVTDKRSNTTTPSRVTNKTTNSPTPSRVTNITTNTTHIIKIPIFRLPEKLLFKIVTLLPVISQACLSLSCKTFFALTGSALGSEQFRLPAKILLPQHRWGVARTWRWDFLGLLEDDRWLRCSGCIKLHPTAQFPPLDRHRFNSTRICRFGNLFIGILYLCPCVQVTFREKLRLISQLEKTLYRKQNAEEVDAWHECEKLYQAARVHVQIRPALLENGELVIETTYDIECDPVDSPLRGLPYFCCPHMDIDYFVSLSTRRNSLLQSCGDCDTSVSSFNFEQKDDKLYYSTKIIRNLGPGGPRADYTWYDQVCREYANPSRFRRPLGPF